MKNAQRLLVCTDDGKNNFNAMRMRMDSLILDQLANPALVIGIAACVDLRMQILDPRRHLQEAFILQSDTKSLQLQVRLRQRSIVVIATLSAASIARSLFLCYYDYYHCQYST